jgi:hypothetical protein
MDIGAIKNDQQGIGQIKIIAKIYQIKGSRQMPELFRNEYQGN